MIESKHKGSLSLILRDLAQELDVPPSKYEEARDRYDAVGAWLAEDDSALAPYEPIVYVQGSFASGTAVRPLGDDDYDVDSVCLLRLREGQLSQEQLKNMVGDRLKHPRSRYKDMLEPKNGGRRCWTVKYADASKFHLDVLPAIPDKYGRLVAAGIPEQWAKHAICITDKHTWDTDLPWPKSNPKGYAEWFKEQMRVRLEEGRRIIALARKSEVQDVPDYEVRTPLQRVVQLLKRHRDQRYSKDEDRPISIIIATLAARAYNNEASILDALLNVVPGMREGIEERNGDLWVPNPVNPSENFAEKWAQSPRKRDIFFEWLNAVEEEHKHLLTSQGFQNVGAYLARAYGRRDASSAIAKYAARRTEKSTSRSDGNIEAPLMPIVLVPRRIESIWPARLSEDQHAQARQALELVMANEALCQLLIKQMRAVQDLRPDLELVLLAQGRLVVQGGVRFSKKHKGRTVSGEYKILITIPENYPHSPPDVWETSMAIPLTFHRFTFTFRLCLGVRVEVRRVFSEHKTLRGFIEYLVMPFLFSHAYFQEYGEMPYGEYRHGYNGVLDYYNEWFGTTDDLVSLRLLRILATNGQSAEGPCPCGSQRALSCCHGPKLTELRPHQTLQEWYEELLKILRLFQACERNANTCRAHGVVWVPSETGDSPSSLEGPSNCELGEYSIVHCPTEVKDG